MFTITKTIIKKIYKKRNIYSRKYDFGSLLIIGGSKKYSGSPGFNILAALAMASYRSGVDIVEIAAPERAANIAACFSPDIIAYPLKGEYISMKHINQLLKLTTNKTAVVIGGGIERRKETIKTIIRFIEKIELPCVVDADAIYAISNKKSVLNENIVVTPHAYEFYILTGKNVSHLPTRQKIMIVKKEAKQLNCTILLKGNPDIISDGENVGINKTGNPYMTVGGTGDILAGILGSLLAQKIDIFTASCAAAYINGKAGDIAAKKMKHSLVASDLIKEIPKVIT